MAAYEGITPTRVDAIVKFLEGAAIDFEVIEHEPVMTAMAEAGAAHTAPDEVAKTVVLCDDEGYVIAAIPAAYRLDLHKLRAQLGASRKLRLATEDEIARDFPLLEVGAVPPFGPTIPKAEVIDRALLEHERILCIAGDHRHSVLIDPHDIARITGATAADICQD